MIHEALAHYHFQNPIVELIRHNENMTYKVTDGEEAYVLRIHKPCEGFNVDMLSAAKDKTGLLRDEIKLLQHLADGGRMQTQQVKPNAAGNPVTMLGGIPVTVLQWIEGRTLENLDITLEMAGRLGSMIGGLHKELAQATFANRYRYDGALLSRMMEEASRALQRGSLTQEHAQTIMETLSHIRSYLSDSSDRFIPVHADLGKSNLVDHHGVIVPIDFSLFGYCIPEMDLASVFTHLNDEALHQEVLRGYTSTCGLKIDDLGIQICFSLQILLFVITQHSRFAGETWFAQRLTEWCHKRFEPLIKTNGKTMR